MPYIAALSRFSLFSLATFLIGKATGTSPESWLNMQTKLDLWKAEKRNPKVIAFPIKKVAKKNKEKRESAVI